MTSIRVADVTELPPGKGKMLSIADREVIVYNLAGRLVATATRELRVSHHPPEQSMDTTHPRHGTIFDVHAEDSPARVHAAEERLNVRLDGDAIWLDLPDEE